MENKNTINVEAVLNQAKKIQDLLYANDDLMDQDDLFEAQSLTDDLVSYLEKRLSDSVSEKQKRAILKIKLSKYVASVSAHGYYDKYGAMLFCKTDDDDYQILYKSEEDYLESIKDLNK